jgi:creatinine amidohydrolase
MKNLETFRIEDMTWPEVKDALENGVTTVVFAVGSTEQHGPHLPTRTDAAIGDAWAEGVAKNLQALMGPTIHIGCSAHHMAFPGTVTLTESTLTALLHDYIDSLVHHGFRKIVILPSHGGNFPTVRTVLREAKQKHPSVRFAALTDLMSLMEVTHRIAEKAGIAKEAAGSHAGENETGFMLALHPHLVRTGRYKPGYTGPFSDERQKKLFGEGMHALSSIGVLGDPRGAEAARGRTYLEETIAFLTELSKKQLEES